MPEMERFEFTIGEDHIPYYLGKQCWGEMCEVLLEINEKRKFDKVFIGCDSNVNRLHVPAFAEELTKRNIEFHVCVTDPGETHKSMASLDFILNDVLTNGCTRNSIIIPFGGGIVGNMFGLASALLFRGIRFVHIPSTFLSAHDSVTSKKQAINHSSLKNICGTYYVPTAIMCNVSVFETLTSDNVRSGSGELTKNAVLFGKDHLSVLEPILRRRRGPDLHYTEEEMLELMRMGIRAKGFLLKDDPKERTTAIIFEYGHTVGHAVELTYGVSHGCAVALGMLAASFMANKIGVMTNEDRAVHDELVELLDVKLPKAPTPELLDAVWKRVAGDNKRGYLPLVEGKCPFILAKKVGEMHKPNEYYLEYVPEHIVKEGIKWLCETHFAEEASLSRRNSRPEFLGDHNTVRMLGDYAMSYVKELGIADNIQGALDYWLKW